MKKSTKNTMNTNMTLRELLILTSTAGKAYTANCLKRQNPIAEYEDSTLHIRVYANGCVLIEDGIRSVVIRMENVAISYDFDPARTADNADRKIRGKQRDFLPNLDGSIFLDQPWYIRLALTAADELEKKANTEQSDFSLDAPAYTDSFEPALLNTMEQTELINTMTTTLTDREAFVITQRYSFSYTLDEVAALLGVTRGRVRQIEVKALRKMRMKGKGKHIEY